MGRLALGMLALVGCYRPLAGEGAPCNVNGECPAPLTCIDGYCVRGGDPSGGDGTPGIDDADPAADDATTTDGHLTDAASSDARQTAWSSPLGVPGVDSSSTDSNPWMSEDEKTILFSSERSGVGQGDLYIGTRSTASGTFSVSNLGAPVSTSADEHSPHLFGDTLYFTTDKLGGYDVFTSTRSGGVWSTPQREPNLSSTSDDIDVALSLDGKRAIVTRISSGARRFYESTRLSTGGPWGGAQQITELTTVSQVGGPTLAGNGELFFHAQNGSLDLYSARKAGSGFEQPEPIDELGSGFVDVQPHVNSAGTHIVFSRSGRIVESSR